MPGRRPKSTALKIITGNPGKRPLNKDEPQPTKGIPSMPKWLKPFKTAVKEWKREAKILDDMGIMTVAESGNLAQRAYISHKIQKLAIEIEEEGDTIETYGINKEGEEYCSGIKTNPKVVQLKALISEYRQYGSLLGLDAPSRTKFKVGKPREKSKAEEFRARKVK